MDRLSLLGNLANLIGVIVSGWTPFEVARTKKWAGRKIAAAVNRGERLRLLEKIDTLRRATRSLFEAVGGPDELRAA